MQITARADGPEPFYYLRNFHTMLDTLRRRDGDLLAEEEQRFIEGFSRLPTSSQALLVRMAMRQGELFRVSRLRYSEISDIGDAAAPLVERQWLDARPRLTLEELFRLLDKVALAEHLALSRKQAATPKRALLEKLRGAYPDQRFFDEWCVASTDRVYRLRVDGICTRLTLMFFGNFRQDLTEFVLADMGIFKYEQVDLQVDSRPFRDREHVDAFHQLYRCRELLHQGAAPREVAEALPPVIRNCEWLEERREKLRFQVARSFERQGAVAEASEIYATCTHPDARTRARRLHDKAAGIAGNRRARIGLTPPQFELTLAGPHSKRSVERLVLDHLIAEDPDRTQVHYVENGLVNSLFGLLCWPAIFAPIRGAFFHAFHQAPADLASLRFYERREHAFARCFAELECGSYKDTMRRHWSEKAGIASPFVAWGLLDESLLETALECFPPQHLARWFEWILRDVRANRTGFPDLAQFWPGTQQYRLVEVKGPGDRLQDNQRRCLSYCLTHGIPVSVCRVKWAGVTTGSQSG